MKPLKSITFIIILFTQAASAQSIRLDGIFAFEIKCMNEKIDPQNAHGKQVQVPVKYIPEEVKKSDRVADLFYENKDFKGDAESQQNLLEEYVKDTYNLIIDKVEESKDGKSIILNIK